MFALVNDITGSSRNAILSLIVFFAFGFLLLSRVDIDEARRAKEHWRFKGADAIVE